MAQEIDDIGCTRTPRSLRPLLLVALGVAGACSSETAPFAPGEREAPSCDLEPGLLSSLVAPDAIPSLIRPEMVTIGAPGSEYLEDDDRVLGVVVDGQPRAYPHAVLDHHEIVSDRVGDRSLAVTFCPLTGSGLVFDPDTGAEVLDVGVSGLLYANNLVLYDRTTGDVYGPQLSVRGTCSRFRDERLDLGAVVEMSWGRWRRLHPNTSVVSDQTGFDRNYLVSPYTDYKRLDNDDLLFDMPVDASRPLKERVLAVRLGSGGVGYPFGELADSLGSRGALNETIEGSPTAIFYEGSSGEAAIAFHATTGEQSLTFDAVDGAWVDRETGSSWNFAGRAVDGPLAGASLALRVDAFVVFWFAWRHFQPDGAIWGG